MTKEDADQQSPQPVPLQYAPPERRWSPTTLRRLTLICGFAALAGALAPGALLIALDAGLVQEFRIPYSPVTEPVILAFLVAIILSPLLGAGAFVIDYLLYRGDSDNLIRSAKVAGGAAIMVTLVFSLAFMPLCLISLSCVALIAWILLAPQ